MILSSEASAQRGKWRTRPFQGEPMDVLSPSHPSQVVVFWCASQMMKTAILLNFLAYIIAVDPGPVLAVEPRVEDAKTLSQDRVAPMLRNVEALRGKVAESRSRDSDNTRLHKSFIGGHVTFTGAISPSGLAMRPIRYLLLDEVDRYPVSAGGEGDPVNLAIRRTDEFFWNKKIAMASTGTIKGKSRIERAYESSDQRKPFVPCPHCGEMQVLYFDRLEWQEGKPEDAQYRCANDSCAQLIPHFRKAWMLKAGEWRAANPGSKIVGFWLSQMYSTRRSWGDLVQEFLEAKKDPETLKVFVNTVLAQTWEEKHDIKIDHQALMNRAELCSAEVPPGVAVLTVGVDTQDNRLEVQIDGWGADEERWTLKYFVLMGDPQRPEVWSQLDAILKDEYLTEDGIPLRIRACCVDSGGHHTSAVYKYTRARFGARVWAIKGKSGKYPVWPKRPTKGKDSSPLFMVGVDTAKDTVFSRLRIDEPGPGYHHFLLATEFDTEYFEQLTAEKKYTRYRNGYPVGEWRKEPGARNEACDVTIYSYAALQGLMMGGLRLNKEAQAMADLVKRRREERTAMLAGQAVAVRQSPISQPGLDWFGGPKGF